MQRPDARLRDATPADFDAIVRLNADSVQFTSRMPRERLVQLAAGCERLRLVEAGGEVAAFLLAFAPGSAYNSENYRWFAEREPSFLYIDRVVVGERHRGRGLATALYEDAFAIARARGFACVVAEFDVDPPNPVSAALHARFGFREVGMRQVAYADKRVAMQRAGILTSSAPAARSRGTSGCCGNRR